MQQFGGKRPREELVSVNPKAGVGRGRALPRCRGSSQGGVHPHKPILERRARITNRKEQTVQFQAK